MQVAHLSADFGGVAAEKLADPSFLSGLLLTAANAAGLSPAKPPAVTSGAQGMSGVLVCHGGHVCVVTAPDAGLCFVDLAAANVAPGRVQRAADIVGRRLGAKEVRTDVKRRGPVTRAAP